MAAKDLEYLTLEDITCVDVDDKVFEHYDRLEVAKDIFREDDGISSVKMMEMKRISHYITAWYTARDKGYFCRALH